MGRHQASGALLESLNHCVAKLRPQADKRHVALNLAIAGKLGMLAGDDAGLHEAGRSLLRYALRRAEAGSTLVIRADLPTPGELILTIDQTCGQALAGRSEAREMDAVRSALDLVGGQLTRVIADDGRLSIRARLPVPQMRARSDP